MRWHRETDYHGSRSYGSEQARPTTSGLVAAWLGAIVKGKLRKMRGRAAPPLVSPHRRDSGFSILGTNSRTVVDPCPFPVKPHSMDPNWRVLP